MTDRHAQGALSPGARLRSLLSYGSGTQLMGVHDGMSAQIATRDDD